MERDSFLKKYGLLLLTGVLVGAAAVIFAAGVKLRWFVLALAGGSGLIALAWSHLPNYIQMRFLVLFDHNLDPQDIGFHQTRSLLAIGSGGLTGLGLGNGRQKFLYLPEAQNDFIFAIVCEELGLIGACLILAVFALLIIRGYWLALHARDKFGA